MKKFACMIFAMIICFCSLSGCTPEGGKQTRYIVDLSQEIPEKYLEVDFIRDFVPAESEENLEVSVKGVLDYAYYEDVVLTFLVRAYELDPYAVFREYEVYVTLNAAGDAKFRVEYSGLPLLSNGIGKQIDHDYHNMCELFGFNRTIQLKSVTGKVIYTI